MHISRAPWSERKVNVNFKEPMDDSSEKQGEMGIKDLQMKHFLLEIPFEFHYFLWCRKTVQLCRDSTFYTITHTCKDLQKIVEQIFNVLNTFVLPYRRNRCAADMCSIWVCNVHDFTRNNGSTTTTTTMCLCVVWLWTQVRAFYKS